MAGQQSRATRVAEPVGAGRPGWHAECTAIALHAFGSSVDVQAGGGDLRFPHHAYQAALAEALTGVAPFARAAFTVGVVRVAGQKMAKSRETSCSSPTCWPSIRRRRSGC